MVTDTMNNKIRILYLTTTSKVSGAEKIMYELSKRINKERFEIMVCTIKDDLKEGLLEKSRDIGIKAATLGVENKWKFYKSFQLFKIIKEFNPHILQSFLFFDNILARVFGKITGLPVIISGLRNVEPERSSFRNFFDKLTFPFADLVISNTESGKKFLTQKFKLDSKKIKVIYNGIEIDSEGPLFRKKEFLLDTGLLGNEKIVGFVGRLEKQKGVQYLIEAMRIINKHDLSIYALIIGDGREKDKLEKYAQSFDCRVIFLGWKYNIFQYLKYFDLFILPSLREGMPNVVLEAMGQGIPVIATNVGGNKELIEDGKTGFLLEPKNSEQLAKKILEILNFSEKEKQLITSEARKNVTNNFSIERMVTEFEETYLCLLEKY